jgi:hypothetical protein
MKKGSKVSSIVCRAIVIDASIDHRGAKNAKIS